MNEKYVNFSTRSLHRSYITMSDKNTCMEIYTTDRRELDSYIKKLIAEAIEQAVTSTALTAHIKKLITEANHKSGTQTGLVENEIINNIESIRKSISKVLQTYSPSQPQRKPTRQTKQKTITTKKPLKPCVICGVVECGHYFRTCPKAIRVPRTEPLLTPKFRVFPTTVCRLHDIYKKNDHHEMDCPITMTRLRPEYETDQQQIQD